MGKCNLVWKETDMIIKMTPFNMKEFNKPNNHLLFQGELHLHLKTMCGIYRGTIC